MHYKILEYKNSQFIFKLCTNSGTVYFISITFDSYSDCQNGVECLRKTYWRESHYIDNEGKDGWFYFKYHKDDGTFLGESRRYKTKGRMLRAKDCVLSYSDTSDLRYYYA